MVGRNMSLSWTSEWLVEWLVRSTTLSGLVGCLNFFLCMCYFYFFKLVMVELAWFPLVADQSHPSYISVSTTQEPLFWFPTRQTRRPPFFFHNLSAVIQLLTLTYKKKTYFFLNTISISKTHVKDI